METKNPEDLYEHIRNIAKNSCCDINFLNDEEVIRKVEDGQLSTKQLESICAIRYWYNVVVLNKMKSISQTHKATTETTITTNASFISSKGSEYAKNRSAHQDKYGINTYYLSETKAECYGKLLLRAATEDLKKTSILYIGARTEAEILYMGKFGFSPKNIQGLDLHTYSPLIRLGDMHDIPFKDNNFDICILTHCIAYSEEPEIAIKEGLRILKPNGKLIFTVSSIHKSKNYKEKPDIKNRPRTGAINILEFEQYVDIAKENSQILKESIDIIKITNEGQPLMQAATITKK